MANIYQYAALTLAATASSGDARGCFPTSPREIREVRIALPRDLETPRLAVRPLIPHWDTADHRDFNRHFPLLSRAWVLQERLLSARMLHFCNLELAWECRELITCKCGGFGSQISPSGQYHRVLGIQLRRDNDALGAYLQFGKSAKSFPFLQRSIGRQLDLPDDKCFVEHVSQFHRIVEQYSSLQLTKSTDRLPALAGLCSRLQKFRGTYAAGLWSDAIIYNLMW